LSGLAARQQLRLAGAVLVVLLVFIGETRAQQPSENGLASGANERIGVVRGAAAAALERWDVPGAREALARLGDSREPEDLLLRARLAHQAGAYAEAVRLLDQVPPSVATLEPIAAFARLAAASLAMNGRLTATESEHFVLRFDPERDWVLAEPALEALEAGYSAIGGWLGERTSRKVRVEIAPSAEDFELVSGLTHRDIETGGAVGVTAFDKIVVLSPRLLARGYPWRDALNHEYLHYLLVLLSANRAPVWLQEGFARYGEARWRTPNPEFLDAIDNSLLALALRENTLLPLSAMNAPLVRLSSPGSVRLAFAECALAVDYLIGGWQVDGLRRVIAELAGAAGHHGMDSVLVAAIGEPLARFEEGWRRMIGNHGFNESAGVAVPFQHLAGKGDVDAWDLAEWQPLAAQNHLQLGDLLRARGNLRAALMEYDKARSVAPGSPYVHVKRARALLDVGKAPAAADAAREAVRLGGGYPAAYVALAAALTALGDHEGAAAALRGAIELNPFDPFAWRDLGRALRKRGRAQQAQSASVTALRLMPDNQAFMRSVMQDE
jgi:tetratricopeptide (TPR) repeat protein